MGTEYYILKPDKKELFYLGKHFVGFNKIPNAAYGKEAEYPSYEDWDEFFWDVLQENWDYFVTMDITLSQVSDLVYKMYEWCVDSKVVLSNDCMEDAKKWLNWTETEDITKILKELHTDNLQENYNGL